MNQILFGTAKRSENCISEKKGRLENQTENKQKGEMLDQPAMGHHTQFFPSILIQRKENYLVLH